MGIREVFSKSGKYRSVELAVDEILHIGFNINSTSVARLCSSQKLFIMYAIQNKYLSIVWQCLRMYDIWWKSGTRDTSLPALIPY